MSSLERVGASEGEKPKNGISGLKHWRNDWVVGLQLALPLSLGIAVASGALPITGVISAQMECVLTTSGFE